MRSRSSLATAKGWRYRLRLKGNLEVWIKGQKSNLKQQLDCRTQYLKKVEVTYPRVLTNIGIVNDPDHDEPWLIAMSANPSYATMPDYSARWGIEPMFPDTDWFFFFKLELLPFFAIFTAILPQHPEID